MEDASAIESGEEPQQSRQPPNVSGNNQDQNSQIPHGNGQISQQPQPHPPDQIPPSTSLAPPPSPAPATNSQETAEVPSAPMSLQGEGSNLIREDDATNHPIRSEPTNQNHRPGNASNVGSQNDPAQQNHGNNHGNAQQQPVPTGPSQATLGLWREVAHGLDKSSTVVWTKAVESLEAARRHLHPLNSTTNISSNTPHVSSILNPPCPEAREFVNKYMLTIVSILLEQQPSKIGQMEKECVEKSVRCALAIVRDDLIACGRDDLAYNALASSGKLSSSISPTICPTLDVLANIFNKKKVYYKGNKGWSNSIMGLPHVRISMISKFRQMKGFAHLASYLNIRAGVIVTSSMGPVSVFPGFDVVQQLLTGVHDATTGLQQQQQQQQQQNMNSGGGNGNGEGLADQQQQVAQRMQSIEQEARHLCQAVMKHFSCLNEETLKRIPSEAVKQTSFKLQCIYERLALSNPRVNFEFFSFWRSLIWKYLTSQSLPLKLFGWEQVGDIIDACRDNAPPPRAFIVSGAGCSFINGRYEFDPSKVDKYGFVQPNVEISYEMIIPFSKGPSAESGGECTDGEAAEATSKQGKKITLFRCTMRSQQKWWFLSEADEDQPGTDKDIDYYQHKSRQHEEKQPPVSGWATCRAGVDPPPTLRAVGAMVPPGEEYNTLEHQLAKWAIENGVIELVLGDSIHREIVARSTCLINFLAGMCNKDDENEVPQSGEPSMQTEMIPNQYCLKTSHLLLAWKTCMNKADAAVSAEIYQLLVNILPSLSEFLAVPLIKEIHNSLCQSSEKGNHFYEVSEFCYAIATSNNLDGETNGNITTSSGTGKKIRMNAEVREEILSLQWAVLTHEDALTLKSYESIKKYVAYEIRRQEPMTNRQRDIFLSQCQELVSKNSVNEVVDEVHAFHMVQLTRFILEAYPRDEIEAMIMSENEWRLPTLLLSELIAYLNRREKAQTLPPARKPSSTSLVPEFNHILALKKRLAILRYMYGLSPTAIIGTAELDHLWSLCSRPSDREAIMSFLATASQSGMRPLVGGQVNGPTDDPLFVAFEKDTCRFIFENLFCSINVGWESLGDIAYDSFRSVYENIGKGKPCSLDALWRICLTAGIDSIAIHAMNDLLAAYDSVMANNPAGNAWSNSHRAVEETFSKRIFNEILAVNKGLLEGDATSERSAERCIRILKAAIDRCSSLGGSAGAAAERMASLPPTSSLHDYLSRVPHGLRGQFSCKSVFILVKDLRSQSNQVESSPRPSPGQNPTQRCERFKLNIHPLETLAAIRRKVAAHCNQDIKFVKPTSLSGREVSNSNPGSADMHRLNLNTVPETTLAVDMGIIDGCEMIVMLSNKPLSTPSLTTGPNMHHVTSSKLDLSMLFDSRGSSDGSSESSDLFFDTLISMLQALPMRDDRVRVQHRSKDSAVNTHDLVWGLMLAMPTNAGMIERVRVASMRSKDGAAKCIADDAMVVDSDSFYNASPLDGVHADKSSPSWSNLLDFRQFERSVYVMQVIDSILRPEPGMFSSLNREIASRLESKMLEEANAFLTDFIESGGFDAVMNLFIQSGNADKKIRRRNRMGNAFALRILTFSLLGSSESDFCDGDDISPQSSSEGEKLIKTLTNPIGFLRSLIGVVVDDEGITNSTILRVLQLVRIMLTSDNGVAASFVNLPVAETFSTSLLLWDGVGFARSHIESAIKVRRSTEDMILAIPLLSTSALPWLVKALTKIDPSTDGSCEFFSVLMKLVRVVNQKSNQVQLKDLGSAVCNKLASYPLQNRENIHVDYSTGVLCGCLRLLVALIETAGGAFVVEGSSFLLRSLDAKPWSQDLYLRSTKSGSDCDGLCEEDKALIDLMGAIFDGFISSAISPGLTPICCDNESRQLAFNVASAAAKSCTGGNGYNILVAKIRGIISHVAPSFRHSWGQNISNDEGNTVSSSSSVKYSGLRNQGCTCYMNSFLQQLFMMPALRKSICSAVIPSCLRSSGGGTVTKGSALVGKKISLHWDCGNSYDAIVDSFNEHTGMHTISYCPLQLATPVGPTQIHSMDVSSLPKELPEEFILSEGRPGKETGAFEILSNNSVGVSSVAGENSQEILDESKPGASEVKESDDEASSRRLLEEVQRTFVNLEEARGRCFDPRSLVEASNCLKLEFDVWQQNDASEFAMKLLDRLEIPLKRWSPKHFKYLAHTFGLKSTKQKICKECGLKTNREESLMNIDCQIRNKSNIHEALSTMCEDEIMEGDNKVLCDRCKMKTNTVLRTAISTLPDMLVLSLKRFDLDYNTFETVKLNSRCEFGESLNMKQYTLEAKEILESVRTDECKSDGGSMMDLGESDANEDPDKDPLSILPDEDYEYKLAGVLVHAGVAQGGHYYSFIKHRLSNKWYRFDDEDVTSFDPALIEQECFGGKVKKETKFPNGNVHTVESEQFANALMLFYEKVKPVKFEESTEMKNHPDDGSPMEEESSDPENLELSSGYDVFLPEVKKSNSTHSWQLFLLTNEFQSFVSGMLDLCTETSKYSNEQDNNMDITPVSSPSPVVADIDIDSWRFGIVKMTLSYVFDIIFHLSLPKNVIQQWTTKFRLIFSASSDVTSAFVADLARRTHTVYENWIRAFTVECSEDIPRRAAIEIFTSAIFAQLNHPTEQSLLRDWVQGWRAQVSEFERLLLNKRQHIGSMPTKLEMGQSRQLEDVSSIGESATGIGIILSFVTLLTELLPRYVQTNCDLCYFIRELASNTKSEGHLLREAMNEAQFPARLTCLAIRDKSHSLMRHAFPGASICFEVVEAISKQETSSSSLLHMGNPGINSGQSVHIPSAYNQMMLLEAIGCLLNMQWVKQEQICYETGEVNRGRALVALSDKAVEALTIMFQDCKIDSMKGLTRTNFDQCMSFFRVDVPPQRIESAFNRHAVIDDSDGTRVLTLNGFLAYYRDLAQNSDHQVRCDIQHFGFRPDLSRRPEDARWYIEESGEKWPYTDTESIACDVALNHASLSNITKVPELNLFSLPFITFANNNCTPLAEYILAAVAFGKDTSRLMQDALKQYNHNADWGVPDLISACTLVFRVLVSIPDDRQMDRINMLMLNEDKGRNGVVGFMRAGEELVNRYQGNDDNINVMVERYVELIKDLQEHNAVNLWMKKNKSYWEWMNEDNEIRPDASPPLSSRRDYSGLNQNQQGHSDSDAAANDSDDDSEYFDNDKAVKYMTVDGSGIAQVNGTYVRSGSCDGVAKYVRSAQWEGEEEDFMIFRCQLSDRSRRWYISIVPHNIHPGTTKDIDFFAAAAPDRSVLPPREGWIAVIKGKPHPITPPSVYPVERTFEDMLENDLRSSTFL